MKKLSLLNLLLAVSLWELCANSYANFPSETLLPHESSAFELAFSTDGKWLAADGNDHKIYIWDVSAASKVHTLAGHEGHITGLAFRSNDELISASVDGTVRLWNVTEEREIRRFRAGLDQVTSIALSPDEQQVVFGVTDGTLRLWQIDSGLLRRVFRGHVDVVLSVDFSSDGEQIVSGSDDNTVRLWDVSTGTLIETFVGHVERVWSVAMHPDGELIASGSWDGTVRLWKNEPAAEAADEDEGSNLPLATYDRPVLSVAFSPDARLLAIGLANSERDNSVKFWDVAGQNVARYQELRSFDAKSKHDLAFSPEGKLFATTGGDNTSIRVWRADPATPVPLSPRGETLVEPPSTILQWQAAGDAIYHDIEIALDADFFVVFESATVLMNRLTFSLEIELSQFWWRVRTGGFGIVSDWSEPSSFLTPFEPPRTCSVQLIPQHLNIGLEEEFTVKILADSLPDLAGFQFDLRWTDPDLLTFVTVTEFKSIFGASGIGKPGEILQDEGLYEGVAATRIGEPNPDNSGILLEVLFRSKAAGTCKIQLENFKLANSDQEPIDCPVTEATVIVEEPLRPWDVNRDGVVDIFDLVIVTEFFGQRIVFGLEINPDVNRDGVVNILDLTLVASRFGDTYENDAQAPGAIPSEINAELSQAELRRIYTELIRSLDESPLARRAIQALEEFIISFPPRQNLLLQNYPNPFNPETWLPFQITATSDVSMHIYSNHGHLVRRIPLGIRPPGRYISTSEAAHWDGKNDRGEPVAAGTYFYTLSTDTFTATKKMIVTK
ncbi:MAG: dockerin type I domain-containing protein [Candidatus Poribacteria bacterium]|nr:dockerin type I domain-containing protein [Candidatus Poribacteria bacterium]MDE0503446.1 dockerin type I domain-containing protein [Candidatus Poribacteria bacterium]